MTKTSRSRLALVVLLALAWGSTFLWIEVAPRGQDGRGATVLCDQAKT